MHSRLTFVAGAALLSTLVSAAPAPDGWSKWSSTAPSSGPTPMPQPFSFPLPNGFPNPSQAALMDIEKQAHGTLPNGPLPNNLAAGDLTTLQLLAFNEIFEVAYFTSLLANITSGVSGYDAPADKQSLVDAITAVQAQEQLHALGVNALLQTNGKAPVQPCKYKFPVSDLKTALTLAYTFTDIVLGTLQDAEFGFATNKDYPLVPLFGSVIGQEGEQNGYYRALTGKIPSALPFLTRSAGPFAYSALNQLFVVPGSCPNANLIDIPIFEPLMVTTQNVQAADQTLQFSTSATGVSGMSVVYINQQNTPVVVTPTNIQTANGMTTFSATFPYSANLMNGLTLVALTKSAGPFASVPAVADATVAGPGIIEIN